MTVKSDFKRRTATSGGLSRRTFLAASAIGGSSLLCAPYVARAQAPQRLTIAAGHAEGFLWVRYLKEAFIPTVNEELKRRNAQPVEWNEAFGGTVSKPGSELENMESGVADCGTVMTVFHAAKMPLMNVTFAAPFGPTDPALVMNAVDGLHQKVPAFGGAWNRNGLVHLASVGVDCYQMYTNFPIKSVADLKGKKIGGAGPNLLWLDGTGAVGVASPAPQAYNNIRTGVIDGYILYHTGAAPARFQEVAQHVTVVNFGAMLVGAIAVNRGRWEKFSDDTKAAFRAGADAYSKRYIAGLIERRDAAEKEMRTGGAQFSELPAAERTQWIKGMANPAVEWAKQANARGEPARDSLKAYIESIAASGYKLPRDFAAELS